MDYSHFVGEFEQPPTCYRPMMFWIWNGELTRERIAAQVQDLADKGCGGFFIHPMGENFRLKDFVAGMSPDYLSAEYFALVRHAVECARDAGLYAWLYDEGGWPSGSAQGHVVQGHPEFCGHRLHVKRLPFSEAIEVPDNAVAALGIPDIGVPRPLELRDLASTMTPCREILLFTLEPDGYAIDILNPAAVRRFIDVTHERYRETVGEFFGSTIPGMFTDETSLGGRVGTEAIAWTRGFLEHLSAHMGRDARIYLPLLFHSSELTDDIRERYSSHELHAARCEYMDCLTRRFGEAYWKQISDWCAANDLIHTGHVGGEDNLPDHASFGHFFRTAGQLHAPGVDAIWRQIFPGQDNFPFPRLAASAAKQRVEPSPGCFGTLVPTETNGVYSPACSFEHMRWVADYQLMCGVNMLCPMSYSYTTEGGRLFRTMDLTGPGNPLWEYYRGFADYQARMSLLVRCSSEETHVAVYYPAETLWADPQAAQKTWEDLKDVCGLLTEAQTAFDFIDSDTLAAADIHHGALQAGPCTYRHVFVCAAAMPVEALSRLGELAENGGSVVFARTLPALNTRMTGREAFENARLAAQRAPGTTVVTDVAALERVVAEAARGREVMQPADPDPDLRMAVRRAGTATVVLLANDTDSVKEPLLNVTLQAGEVLEAWDPKDGDIAGVLGPGSDGRTDFRPILTPWATQVFVVRPGKGDGQPAAERDDNRGRKFARWLASYPAERAFNPPEADVVELFRESTATRIFTRYEIRDGDVTITAGTPPEFAFVEGPSPLLDWNEWGLDDFTGCVEYIFDFTLAQELVGRRLLLDLGEVLWAAAVHLNEEFIVESLWHPHVVDITRHVRPGENRLTVRVSNTLANQLCCPQVLEEARRNNWYNTYYDRCIPMLEDRRGGLPGPVRIVLSAPEG